jgi:Putative helicase/Putative conjugal transfer nickase/helicase TraI C-term
MASISASYPTLNLKALPILSAIELLKRLGIDTRLNDWRTLVGLDDSMFNQLIEQPFYRYAEAIQLCPASESDHHAGPGGLLVHTYDVVTIALKKRRGLQLPKGGSVDQINAQRHLWTYAVFAGGLLHDIGKLLGSMRMIIQLKGGKELEWTPHDAPINQNKLAQSYRIEFVKTPYSYHTQVALTLFDFLPTYGRAWLARDPAILMPLCAYLRGDRYESGVIGEILETADMSSTATAQLRPVAQRFSTKPSTIERLVHFMRNWIAEGEIKINKNGGMGWVDQDGFIYIVCRALADKIIRHCDDLGITDLPRDPVRLYDIFQDYGLALPTSDNRAIWNVQISCDEYTHHFTCLKFEARRLFVPTRLPVAFTGTIVDESELKKLKKPQSPKSDLTIAAKTISHEPEVKQEAEIIHSTSHAQEADFAQETTLTQEVELTQETAINNEAELNHEAADAEAGNGIIQAAGQSIIHIHQEAADSRDCELLGGESNAQEADAVNSIAEEITEDTEYTLDQDAEFNSTQEAGVVYEADDVDDLPVFRDTLDSEADYPSETESSTHTSEFTHQEAAPSTHSLPDTETAIDQAQETALVKSQETAPQTIKTKFSKFSVSGEAVFEPGAVSMESEQLPRMFLQWLRINLLERRITVNKVGSLVHVAEGHILLMAPAIFVNFLVLHGLDGPKEHHKLSKRFVRLRLHVKRPGGDNLHDVFVVGANKATRIWVWKLPPSVIYDNPADIPEDNPFIKSTPDIK